MGSDNDTRRTDISGGNNQYHFGEGDQHQTVNQSTVISFSQFMSAVQEGIAEVDREAAAKAEEEVLVPLREIAQSPEPDNEQDRTTLKARIMVSQTFEHCLIGHLAS